MSIPLRFLSSLLSARWVSLCRPYKLPVWRTGNLHVFIYTSDLLANLRQLFEYVPACNTSLPAISSTLTSNVAFPFRGSHA